MRTFDGDELELISDLISRELDWLYSEEAKLEHDADDLSERQEMYDTLQGKISDEIVLRAKIDVKFQKGKDDG